MPSVRWRAHLPAKGHERVCGNVAYAHNAAVANRPTPAHSKDRCSPKMTTAFAARGTAGFGASKSWHLGIAHTRSTSAVRGNRYSCRWAGAGGTRAAWNSPASESWGSPSLPKCSLPRDRCRQHHGDSMYRQRGYDPQVAGYPRPHLARRRPRTHHAATIAVGTAHPARPAAATVHIPCVSYTPFGTTVAVMPAEMSPRIAQPTRATPQRSRRPIWAA